MFGKIISILILLISAMFVLNYSLVHASGSVTNTPSVSSYDSPDNWKCPGNQCDRCSINGWWAQGCWDWCQAKGCQMRQGIYSPCGNIALYCRNSQQGTCLASGYRCGNDSCGHPDTSCGRIITLTPFPTALPLVGQLTVTPTPHPNSNLNGSFSPTCDPNDPACIRASEAAIGFKIPSLSTFLSFAIRGAFIIAGLLALIFLITGAIAWITSGGNKENVDKARDKITAAVLGVIILAGVLAVIVTLEQVVFRQTVCFGISCNLTIPSLLKCPVDISGKCLPTVTP